MVKMSISVNENELSLLRFAVYIVTVIPMRIMRISFVGELGYELHMANENCVSTYKKLVDIGRKYGLNDAGFRAYNSLNCEAGAIRIQYACCVTRNHVLVEKKTATKFSGLSSLLFLLRIPSVGL